MSCQPCGRAQSIPLCAIYSILERAYCQLCSTTLYKQNKYENYRCMVRLLSRYSVDPRGGYSAFLGLRDNDLTKTAAIYIDNLRGEYDPNIGTHRVYHVAFVVYGDTNGICRVLKQRADVISGNSAEWTGESPTAHTVAMKAYRSQGGINDRGGTYVPMGLNTPFAGNAPVLIPGTPSDINFGNDINIGGEA